LIDQRVFSEYLTSFFFFSFSEKWTHQDRDSTNLWTFERRLHPPQVQEAAAAAAAAAARSAAREVVEMVHVAIPKPMGLTLGEVPASESPEEAGAVVPKGLRVLSVAAGSAADGKVRERDVLVEVQGADVTEVGFDEAMDRLKEADGASGEGVRLVFARRVARRVKEDDQAILREFSSDDMNWRVVSIM
jgi:hypothetical protein